MKIIIISILIGFLAGGCIYGKTFWENRIKILGIIGGIMFVGFITAIYIIRPNLETVYTVTEKNNLVTMRIFTEYEVPDTAIYIKEKDTIIIIQINKPSIFIPNIDIRSFDKEELVSAKFKNTIIDSDSGEITIKVPSYYEFNYLINISDNSKHMYFQYLDTNNRGKIKKKIHFIETVLFKPIPNNENPIINKIEFDYDYTGNWVPSFIFQNWICTRYIVYLHNAEYEALPSYIKENYTYSGIDDLIIELTKK